MHAKSHHVWCTSRVLARLVKVSPMSGKGVPRLAKESATGSRSGDKPRSVYAFSTPLRRWANFTRSTPTVCRP